MIAETLTIAHRFRGPPRSGNGGYVCGRIARHVPGVASVRLSVPPPLDTQLQIEVTDGIAKLMDGTTVIGTGRPAQLELTPPAPVSFAAATEASHRYRGFEHHTFPGCFVCGPRRAPGDGLRLFAGAVQDREVVAAPWVVDASLGAPIAEEFLWAALDCPSGFALWPGDAASAIVLGELTARIEQRVEPGDECVVMGWPIRIEGRKRTAGSAVFSPAGTLVALARATWIEVAASAFPAEP